MPNIIVISREWNKKLAVNISKRTKRKSYVISKKEDLNMEYLKKIDPKYIFFVHWSYIIPKEIHNNFECVIFHMTDLPFGRGGSPLQNLIVLGFKETVISALKCVEEIDAGPIYLKKPLNLMGSAEEIYIRSNHIIEEMIIEILEKQPLPIPQKGEVFKFKRRKPDDGNFSNLKSLDEIYDYIRMLDAEGYPSAFIKIGNFKLEFNRASKKVSSILANVKITQDKSYE